MKRKAKPSKAKQGYADQGNADQDDADQDDGELLGEGGGKSRDNGKGKRAKGQEKCKKRPAAAIATQADEGPGQEECEVPEDADLLEGESGDTARNEEPSSSVSKRKPKTKAKAKAKGAPKAKAKAKAKNKAKASKPPGTRT